MGHGGKRGEGAEEEEENSEVLHVVVVRGSERLSSDVGPMSTLIALMVPSLYPSFISCSYKRRRF